MKTILKISTLLCILSILNTSCKKDEPSVPFPTNAFVGNFQAKDMNYNIISKNVELFLNHDNTFSFNNQNKTSYQIDKYMYYVVSGSGKYSIENNTITFQDTLIRTLQFKYPYYLSGKYKYHFDGDKLILNAESSIPVISYKLELVAMKNF